MKKNDIYTAVEDTTWQNADPRARYNMRSDMLKIMPEKYQATYCRKFHDCLLVLDNFLSPEKYKILQDTALIMASKTGGWPRSLNVINKQIKPGSRQIEEDRISLNDRIALESAIDDITKKVHTIISPLTQPQHIVKYNTWINTGSIVDQENPADFHFWHYDSDEYIESFLPEDWLRFPVWGAVYYINQPEQQQHFTVFDDQRINQKIRSVNNRLVIFDPTYMHKVIGTNAADDTNNPRLVMAFNAWDYDALDDAIDIQKTL